MRQVDAWRPSRRDILKLGMAAGVAGLTGLAGCGAVPAKPDQSAPAAARRGLQPRRHRRRPEGHPRAVLPGDQPGHRPVHAALRAPAAVERELRDRALGGRVRHAERRQHPVDDQAARRRGVPQRQDAHGRGRHVQPGQGHRPEEARVRRHRAGQDPRAQELEDRRPEDDPAAAQPALRRARPAPGRVHRRHAPDRVRRQPAGRHRPVQVQPVRPGPALAVRPPRQLLGRAAVRRPADHLRLRRRRREGQRAARGPGAERGQPAQLPRGHDRAAGRLAAGLRDGRVGAVHDARRRRAVLRRAGAAGAAADRRPPADDRPGAQRLRHPRQRHVLAVRPRLRQGPAAARAGHRPGQVAAASRRARRTSTSSWSPRPRSARVPWSRRTCSSSRPRRRA